MSRPPKKHWMELFEKRIEDLDGKISDIEQHMEILNRSQVLHSRIVADILFTYLMKPKTPEDFDPFMKKIERLVEVIEESKRPIRTMPPENLVNMVLKIAKGRDIPFQNLAPYLIKKLGKRLAKKIVEKETILQTYGEGAFTIWELLLKKGS